MTSASQDFEKTRNEDMAKKPVKSNEGLSIDMSGNKGVANTHGENDGWVTKTPSMDDQPKSGLKWSALIFAGVSFVLVTIAAASSTMGAVSSANKDMHVRHDGTHHPMATDGKGNVLQTGSPATYEVALYVATVIPDDVLFKVGELRVTLPDLEFDANALYSYHISSVKKVNSTVLVFYAVGGEEIRLVNGVSTVRLSANGMDIPVCSANVTCAAFEVDSSALAAKYTAEADALLAPFVARRRLEGNNDEGYEDNTVCTDLNGESYMKCLAKKCLRNARKAKKAAEAAQVALTGTGAGVGEGGIVEKQLTMEQSLATIKGVFGTGFVNCGNGGDCGNGWESQNGKSNGFSGTIDERLDVIVRALFAILNVKDICIPKTPSFDVFQCS